MFFQTVYTALIILCAILTGGCSKSFDDRGVKQAICKEEDMWLGDWLKINNPIAIDYLSSLKSSDIGKVLEGVRLCNGDNPFHNLKYLGQAKNMGKGIHLYLFSGMARQYAYIWIDKEGEPLQLPDCAKGPDAPEETAYVLSGDVYTWWAVQPGDGVVISQCPIEEWLQMAK